MKHLLITLAFVTSSIYLFSQPVVYVDSKEDSAYIKNRDSLIEWCKYTIIMKRDHDSLYNAKNLGEFCDIYLGLGYTSSWEKITKVNKDKSVELDNEPVYELVILAYFGESGDFKKEIYRPKVFKPHRIVVVGKKNTKEVAYSPKVVKRIYERASDTTHPNITTEHYKEVNGTLELISSNTEVNNKKTIIRTHR